MFSTTRSHGAPLVTLSNTENYGNVATSTEGDVFLELGGGVVLEGSSTPVNKMKETRKTEKTSEIPFQRGNIALTTIFF